jgi:hypothetical protein
MVYEVQASHDYYELTKIVCEKMLEGWECLGGINCDDTRYLQSMIHRELDPTVFLEELAVKMTPVKF